MYRILYTIPIAATQLQNVNANEKIRVGNIFDTERQQCIINTSSETGSVKTLVKFSVDVFSKVDNDNNTSLEIKNTEIDPLLIRTQGVPIAAPVPPSRTLMLGGTAQNLSSNRTWLWTPSKYHIEISESVSIPAKYQQVIWGELINEGEIINEGQLIIN